MAKTHDTPSGVVADNGDVLMDGPGPVAVAMTPAAARETGRRLIEHAAHAHGQRLAGPAGEP